MTTIENNSARAQCSLQNEQICTLLDHLLTSEDLTNLYSIWFKWTVYPEMKIDIINAPSCCSKPVWIYFSSVEHWKIHFK